MKTGIYYIGCFLFAIWIGFVDFASVPKCKVREPKAWQPTYEGLMEVNSAKANLSKAEMEKEIIIQKVETYIENEKELAIIQNHSLIRLSESDN